MSLPVSVEYGRGRNDVVNDVPPIRREALEKIAYLR